MNGNELAKSFYVLRKFEELNIQANHSKSIMCRMLSIYQYPSTIHQRIIFHSLSQSWLLALTKQFKLKLIEEGDLQFHKISFEDILNYFISTPINFTYFYDNMQKCSYRINHTTLTIVEFKLAQVFIEKIEESKKDKTIISIQSPLTKQEFEERLMKLIMITVNYTLNEIDYRELNKGNLFLYQTFAFVNNYRNMNNGCRYQMFINEIIKEKYDNYRGNSQLLTDENETLLMQKKNDTLYYLRLAKLFYLLATTNYNDLLADVKYYVFQNSSWKQKMGLIIKNLLTDKNNVLFRFAYLSIRNIYGIIEEQTKSIFIIAENSIVIPVRSLQLYQTAGEMHKMFTSLIDWNMTKLCDIKETSFSIVNTILKYFSLQLTMTPNPFSTSSSYNNNKSPSNSIKSKRSNCQRQSTNGNCLYLSHFSIEYESSVIMMSRMNNVISDI